MIEEWSRIPCEPDIASEWRYRNPVLTKDTLVVGISQSGETRDTVHALRLARESGARTLAITNMMGTQITQEADRVLYTRAGIEMSVAATKTFTAQVTLLYLLALHLAQTRNTLPEEEIKRSPSRKSRRCLRKLARTSTATIRSRRSPSATIRSRSSCTSAGTSACPSASKAPSS